MLGREPLFRPAGLRIKAHFDEVPQRFLGDARFNYTSQLVGFTGHADGRAALDGGLGEY